MVVFGGCRSEDKKRWIQLGNTEVTPTKPDYYSSCKSIIQVTHTKM